MSRAQLPARCPAPVAPLSPRGSAQTLTFSMPRTLTFSMPIDTSSPLDPGRLAKVLFREIGGTIRLSCLEMAQFPLLVLGLD